MSNRREYNPYYPWFYKQTQVERVFADITKKTVTEKRQENYEEMKELRHLLLLEIKSLIEELIGQNSNVTQEELAKTLASKETTDRIAMKVLDSGKTGKTKAAVKSTYYEIIIEYCVQYMINEEKKSNPNITLSVKKAISCKTAEGSEFVNQMVQKIKVIMNGCNISPRSLTKKIRYIAQKVANREMNKENRNNPYRQQEDMEQ